MRNRTSGSLKELAEFGEEWNPGLESPPRRRSCFQVRNSRSLRRRRYANPFVRSSCLFSASPALSFLFPLRPPPSRHFRCAGARERLDYGKNNILARISWIDLAFFARQRCSRATATLQGSHPLSAPSELHPRSNPRRQFDFSRRSPSIRYPRRHGHRYAQLERFTLQHEAARLSPPDQIRPTAIRRSCHLHPAAELWNAWKQTNGRRGDDEAQSFVQLRLGHIQQLSRGIVFLLLVRSTSCRTATHRTRSTADHPTALAVPTGLRSPSSDFGFARFSAPTRPPRRTDVPEYRHRCRSSASGSSRQLERFELFRRREGTQGRLGSSECSRGEAGGRSERRR